MTIKNIQRHILLSLIIFSTSMFADTIPERRSFLKKLQHQTCQLIENFSQIDTNYVEPQHYNFTIMLQNTNTYERYRLNNQQGQSVVLSPEPSIKIGPYFGWRWIFLGYTLDIKRLNASNQKKEFDISLYTSQIGVDLFYRKTGNGYKMRKLYIGEDINTSPIDNTDFRGFSSSIKGFNLYYIFNHKRFSYPAAFSQSTVQRRSYGSPLVGIGYTKHQMSIDLMELNRIVTEKIELKHTGYDEKQQITFANYQYSDISVSGGYAYNWVFAHNWLFASSLSLGLGYKQSMGDMQHNNLWIRDFKLRNFNIDAIGRFGIVWNNTKWYAGASAIFHTYNYNKNQFSTNTMFGNLNIYVGFNFNRRR